MAEGKSRVASETAVQERALGERVEAQAEKEVCQEPQAAPAAVGLGDLAPEEKRALALV